MIGSVVDGKYRILRLLGQGGMGSVYEAEPVDGSPPVALKLIEAGELYGKGAAAVGRFQREARATGAIETEHIVRVLDSGTDPETSAPYMVMELLRGEDLEQVLARVEALPPDTVLRIAAQVCVGLAKAHEARVVHRDIKPANLFLARRGAGEIVVKILDFGIAKIKRDPAHGGSTTGLSHSGQILGSPLYLSPEQARGAKNITAHTDLWSLGVVLYRALSGKVPHHEIKTLGELIIAICSQLPRPIQEVAPWVSPELAAILHGVLRFDPDERFESAAAMLDAIRRLLPDGWALHEDGLVPVSGGTRATVAPDLALMAATTQVQP